MGMENSMDSSRAGEGTEDVPLIASGESNQKLRMFVSTSVTRETVEESNRNLFGRRCREV
jgi:hypothetical protein